MDPHLSSPEHARERAELVAAVIDACGGGGLEPEAVERLGTVIGRIFDIGCEFDLEAGIAAIAVSRPGSGQRFVDRLQVVLSFPDAEELREEEAREQHAHELKHERSN